MAQIIETGQVPMINGVIYQSPTNQIVIVRFYNKTMANQTITAKHENKVLHNYDIIPSSMNIDYPAHSQHELVMKQGEAISCYGTSGMEFEIIA